jgi:hypothetical protein
MLLSDASFRSELEDGTHHIFFRDCRRVALPAATLWEGLAEALAHTREAWLWPDEFSIHEQEQLPIVEGGFFHTTYRMENPDTGSVNEFRYSYRMKRWRPEERLFEYEAQKGHPFRGGGVVTVKDAGDDASYLDWDGTYRYTADRGGAEEIFSWYFPTFFLRMHRRIRDHAKAREAG